MDIYHRIVWLDGHVGNKSSNGMPTLFGTCLRSHWFPDFHLALIDDGVTDRAIG